MKEHRERETIKGMRKNINKTDDPKNDDLFSEGNYFAYVEAGFTSEWKFYSRLADALMDSCYNEIYIATKMPEEQVVKLKAKVKELREEHKTELERIAKAK